MIRQIFAEVLGTTMLLISLIGSGIMVVTLADGNMALAFLAKPAVTIARGFSDIFAGITPAHLPVFVLALIIAVCIGHVALRRLFRD